MNNNTPPSGGNSTLEALFKILGPAYQQAFSSVANTPDNRGISPMQNYNNARAFDSQVNDKMNGQMQDQMKNGVGGSAVNILPSIANYTQGVAQDSAVNSGLLRDMMTTASGMVNNGVTQGVAQQGNAMNYDVNKQNANTTQGTLQMNQRLSGIDPSTGDFNGNSTTGGGGYSPQGVQKIKDQGGKDLFSDGMSIPQQLQLYSEIQQAGGLENWRKSHPQTISDDDKAVLSGTNDTLQRIQNIQNQIKKSPKLKAALDTPGLSNMLGLNNKFVNQYVLGLSPQDMQALSDMIKLNTTSDKTQVGGRLDNYLLQRIGPSGVGIHNTSQTNIQLLNDVKKHILTNNLTPLAGKYGFTSPYNLPYVQLGSPSDKHPNGSIMLKSPDGKVFAVDQAEAGEALKNGWKETE